MPTPTAKQESDFVNQRIRVAADQWSRSYWLAKRILQEWSDLELSTIPDDDTVIIDDGSGADGRTPVTGMVVHDIVRTCQTIVAFCETANPNFGNRKPLPSITRAAVNGALAN
jgi:hypothetical protein